MTAAGEDESVDCLPDAGLEVGEGAGGGAELLEAGEGEERQCVVECGVGGDAGDVQCIRRGIAEGGAGDAVATAGVAEAQVVQQMAGEDVRLIEDGLLAENMREAKIAAGGYDGIGDDAAIKEA